MLQYLIGVTDNTLISTMIMAALFAVLAKKQPDNQKSIIISGLVFGLLITLVYVFLKRTTGYAVREFYDLGLLIPLIVLVLPFLISIWLFNRCKCQLIFIGLSAIHIALITAQFMPNIFLFPFGFTVGMDSIFNTDLLYTIMGYVFAIIVMFILGLFVYRAASRLAAGVVTTIFTAMMLVFTLQNMITVAQILLARNMIARQDWLMSIVMFILGHVNLFMYIFLGFAVLFAILVLLQVSTTSLVGNNPAQIRKMKAQHRRDRRAAITTLCGVTISLYTITRARYIFEKGVELSPAKELFAIDGMIVIPLEEVNDGNLHRFSYHTSDGTLVRFIVIKKSENAYGVGLDACDICGASGYYQRGDQVVCILCDVVMNIATIGFPGGCNPVPLRFLIADGKMVIKPAHLEAEKSRFR